MSMLMNRPKAMSFKLDSAPANQLMAIQESLIEGDNQLESEQTSIQLPEPSEATLIRKGTVTTEAYAYSASSQSSKTQQTVTQAQPILSKFAQKSGTTT